MFLNIRKFQKTSILIPSEIKKIQFNRYWFRFPFFNFRSFLLIRHLFLFIISFAERKGLAPLIPYGYAGNTTWKQILRIWYLLIQKFPEVNFEKFSHSQMYSQRGRDSNPRYVAVYTLSKRAPSTTRPPL